MQHFPENAARDHSPSQYQEIFGIRSPVKAGKRGEEGGEGDKVKNIGDTINLYFILQLLNL